MEPKCEECIYFEVEEGFQKCCSRRAGSGIPKLNRTTTMPCGPTGKLFVPKDKQEERKWNRPQEQGESDLEYTVRIARGGPKPSEPQGGF